MRVLHDIFARSRPSSPTAPPDGIAWEHGRPDRILSLPDAFSPASPWPTAPSAP